MDSFVRHPPFSARYEGAIFRLKTMEVAIRNHVLTNYTPGVAKLVCNIFTSTQGPAK